MVVDPKKQSWFDAVVLVADLIDNEDVGPALDARRNLEQTDSETLHDLKAALAALRYPCHHYGSPEELARNADRHHNDIVLTVYGGAASRNRMTLVPAVCESFGLRFIGPDVYGRMVAQDKGISKRLATDSGLLTPDWRIIRRLEDIPNAIGMTTPVVVKPLFEGSSIGINQDSLARTPEQTTAIATRILGEFGQPVIVEQFVAGREVALTRIQGPKQGWAFSEIAIDGVPDFFENRLFDAEQKFVRDPRRCVRTIDDALSQEDRASIETFLSCFGDYGYCRVDGRLANGRFHFIEFSPDAWLGRRGQFAASLINKGWTYDDVIAAVIASGVRDPQNQPASG